MINREKSGSAVIAGQKQQKVAATQDPVPPRPNGPATPTAWQPYWIPLSALIGCQTGWKLRYLDTCQINSYPIDRVGG